MLQYSQNKQTLRLLLCFLSSDAMQWCVILVRRLARQDQDDGSVHSCASEARTERKSLPEIREEQTWCYKYIYFKTCTLYTAQWLLYKSRVIIWQKSNISLGAVICLFLLFPIVRCSCCYGPLCFWGVFQSLSVCQVSITSCKLSKGNNRKPQCQAQTYHEILILGRWHQSSAIGFHFTWSIIKLLWLVLCFPQISELIVRQNLMIWQQWNQLNTTAFHEAMQLDHVWRTSQFYKNGW